MALWAVLVVAFVYDFFFSANGKPSNKEFEEWRKEYKGRGIKFCMPM